MRSIIVILLLIESITLNADDCLSSALSQLLANGDVSRFLQVGSNTKKQFSDRRKVYKLCLVKVISGDAKTPIGDGTATNNAHISCPGFKVLGVRIKRTPTAKYHIIGYWSL